jgi:hypothetical protein
VHVPVRGKGDAVAGVTFRRGATVVLAVALLAVASMRFERSVAQPTAAPIATGLTGELVGMYAPDGIAGRSFIASIDLADLSIRTLEVIINEIGGRGQDVFAAVGVPATIYRWDGSQLQDLPGLDQVFLSTLSLSPDHKTLAFARDTRIQDEHGRDEGQEIWRWDLQAGKGSPILALPIEHFVNTLVWLDDVTLLAQVAGRLGEHPELWEIRGSAVTRRFRSGGHTFMLLPDRRIIQIPLRQDADFNRLPVTPYVRSISGSGRQSLVKGWEPIAISPDESQVLFVSKTYDRNRVETTLLGVAPIESLSDIRVVGGVVGGLFEGVWR